MTEPLVEYWQPVGPPQAYVLDLEGGGLDYSTVTAATLYVCDPGGTITTWAPEDVTLSNKTATTLTLTHLLKTTDLVGPPGPWSVYADLAVPGGTIPTKPRRIQVWRRFEVRP